MDRLRPESWPGITGIRTHKHKSALPDVATTFTDGLGYAVNVTYASLANTSNYTMINPETPPAPYVQKFSGARYVVTSEVHDNGVGAGTRSFAHKYDTAFVDVSGRGWSSFYNHRIEDTARGTRTIRYFNRTFPTTGMLTRELMQLNNENADWIRDVVVTLGSTAYAGTTPNRHFARVEATTISEHGIGEGVLRTIVEDPTYETTYGVVSQTTRTVSQPSPSQTWQSVTLFNPINYTTSTEWCLGLPGLVQTTNTLPNATAAVRRIRYTFTPSNCSLAETRDESEASTAKQLKTMFTYDAFGNVDVVSQDSVDLSAQNRSTDFNFDSNGQHPTSIAVGTVNLTTSLTWNYSLGQRASITGPDGLTTSRLYDNFGRVTKETLPAGHTDISYDDCYVCWPQNARLYVRARGSDGSDSYQFLDELQRPVGASWTLPLGTHGRREIRYDSLGRVSQTSQPYVYLDPVFWVTYQYDLLDRVLQENAPVSESLPSGATTTYQYFGRDVWVTDAENHLTRYVHNGAGQISQVIDALNSTTAYTYAPFGELGTVLDAESNTTTIGYDPRGFKSSMSDPNMGSWAYNFNVYGELASQTNALNQNTTMGFDAGGRITSRVETEGTTTFTYYTTGTGARGKPNTISKTNHSELYQYSATTGQPTLIRRTLDGTVYDFDMSYDAQGRLDLLTYPTSTSGYRFKVDYDYDVWGHMNVAKDGDTSAVFYSLTEADALGREVLVDLGNGLDEYRTFDRASGHLMEIDTGPSLSSSIQNLSFTWDEVGNLKTRTNTGIGKTETFTYDALNRLTTTQVGLSAVTMTYSAAGRITSKTDVPGTWTYGAGAPGPYALTSVGSVSYNYDANGRMTSHGSDTFTWYSYDLPKVLAVGTKTAEFFYGVGRDRYKQIQKTGSTTNATIYYVGSLFEKEIAGATTTYRHHVNARGRTIATVSRVGTTNTVQYLHRDHQDSIVEVTNSGGTLVQSLAFDAWGLRRNALTWAALGSPFGGTQPTERGYTGHEHLDSVELIHMNGRAQDPKLGVFIGADPFVQAPYNSQSLNRYSYVWNNPLSFVDPSGFCADGLTPTDDGCYNPWDDPYHPTDIDIGSASFIDSVTRQFAPIFEPRRYTERVRGTASCDNGACSPKTSEYTRLGLVLDDLWVSYWTRFGVNLMGHVDRIDAMSRVDPEAGHEFMEAYSGAGSVKVIGREVIGWMGRIGEDATRGTATAAERARAIQSALSPRTQRSVTTAVTETREGIRIVTSSEGRLRPAQRAALQADEVAGVGQRGVHAEINGVNAARDAGLAPTGVAPSRAACPACTQALDDLGVPLIGP